MKGWLVLALIIGFIGWTQDARAACADMDCSCKRKAFGIEFTDVVFCKPACESAKLACIAAEKVVKETGNALEDLRILVETGKCGGDICDVLEATKNFGVDQIKDTGDSLKRAGERLREGKPLDALWHLQMDYLNNSQENAADAARRSSLLQATGAIAAGAYGGPGGSAGYAAWLTYNETKDLGLALKTGIITGAAAYAATAVNAAPGKGPNVTPGTAAPSVTASQIAARSVMGGVIAGAAVAAAGGKQEEVENAITRGAVAVLIREGYRELTTHELNNKNLQASVGDAFCLKADPVKNPNLSCLPPKESYIRGDNNEIKFVGVGKDRVPEVDLRKLDEYRPHVGTWATEAKAPFFGKAENSGLMKLVSRLPGWNAMSVAHDQFDVLTNPGTGTAIDIIYQTGTIAPFVVLTYEGAGGGVKDMIRSVATTEAIKGAQVANGQPVAPMQSPPTKSNFEDPGHQRQALPTEITHVICRKANVEKNFLMQVALSEGGRVDEFGRVCRIDESLNDKVYPLWHAHFERHSCVSQINRMVKVQIKQQYRCASSMGLRETDIKLAGSK